MPLWRSSSAGSQLGIFPRLLDFRGRLHGQVSERSAWVCPEIAGKYYGLGLARSTGLGMKVIKIIHSENVRFELQ